MKKKINNKILSLFIAMILAITAINIPSYTFAETTSGTCGTDATWEFDDSTGTLTISGTGDMQNYSTDELAPWNTYNSQIKKIVIDDGITMVGDYAFFRTNTYSVSFPDSLESLGDYSLNNNVRLTSVSFNNGLKNIGAYAFSSCTVLAGDIIIPDSVVTIGKSAFNNNKNITNVVIGNGVVDIMENAFGGCRGITTVTFGNSLVTIGNSAFANCSQVQEFIIPDSVTTIGNSAFSYCSSAKNITLGSGVTSLGNSVFGNCSSLSQITIPKSVTFIGTTPFFYCTDLKTITVDSENPNYSDVNGILYDKNVTSLISCPCQYSGSLSIPESVERIESSALRVCTSLTEVIIPDSTTYIGHDSFTGCLGLTSISIPKSVNTVYYDAFNICNNLEKIYFYNESCDIWTSTGTIPENATIYGYADSTAQAYATKNNRIFIPFCSDGTENHTLSSVVTDPTCTEKGYTTNTCSVCGCEYVDAYIDATGHTPVTDPAVEASCTVEGLTEGSHCSTCLEVLVEQENLGYAHTVVSSQDVVPTCTTPGTIGGEICEICGLVIVPPTEVPALGHLYVATVTKESTCTETGVKEYKCSRCSDTYNEIIEMTEHSPEIDEAVSATCFSTGLTEGSHCSVCSTVLLSQEVIPMADHIYISSVTKNSTCTEAGETEYSCKNCTTKYTEAYPEAAGHTKRIVNGVAPSCTKDGYSDSEICDVCGEILLEQTILPMVEHSFEWIIATRPRVNVEGKEEYICKSCGFVHQSRELPAIDNPKTEYGMYRVIGGYGCIKIAWSNDENIEGYKIYTSSSINSDFIYCDTVETNSNSYYVISELPNDSYIYVKIVGYKNIEDEYVSCADSKIVCAYVR